MALRSGFGATRWRQGSVWICALLPYGVVALKCAGRTDRRGVSRGRAGLQCARRGPAAGHPPAARAGRDGHRRHSGDDTACFASRPAAGAHVRPGGSLVDVLLSFFQHVSIDGFCPNTLLLCTRKWINSLQGNYLSLIFAKWSGCIESLPENNHTFRKVTTCFLLVPTIQTVKKNVDAKSFCLPDTFLTTLSTSILELSWTPPLRRRHGIGNGDILFSFSPSRMLKERLGVILAPFFLEK